MGVAEAEGQCVTKLAAANMMSVSFIGQSMKGERRHISQLETFCGLKMNPILRWGRRQDKAQMSYGVDQIRH